MSRTLAVSGAFALALLAIPVAHAATDADLAEIRNQIRQLKESYEARIQALEQRLKEAESKTAAAPPPVAASQPTSPPIALAPAAPAATSAPTGGLSAFNPAISAVLQGVYANLSQDPKQYAISGFVPSGDIAPAKRGFSIAESELGFSANVDDKVYANLIFSLAPDNSVSVEEAYGVLTAMPDGLAPKFGRFLSSIGYLNDQHQHVWDFFDAPLPYQAFLGGQFKSDGLQLKWVAPTDTFLEFGGEIGDGSSFPGTDRNKNGIGSAAAYVHAGGDIGSSNSWRAGLSYLQLRPNDRQYTQTDVAGNMPELSFSGKSQLAIADFVWKWAPNGNAMNTNFKLQGEYFWRKETGDLTYDSDGALGLTSTSNYSSRQSGWYIDGVYQFMPYWRVGARYDRLSTGSVDYGANGIYLAQQSFDPQRYSVMLDYTPSEFSRFRVQWQQSKIRPDLTDNQLFVQYILTIGAHGAHKF
jgi:hypothetical protein